MVGTKTITMKLSQEQFDELQRLAQKQGMSLAGVLRQALEISSLVVNAKVDGQTEILFKRGDSFQELKLAS